MKLTVISSSTYVLLTTSFTIVITDAVDNNRQGLKSIQSALFLRAKTYIDNLKK